MELHIAHLVINVEILTFVIIIKLFLLSAAYQFV